MSVADGYGIVLINEVGNKALTKELNAFDLHLTNYFGEGDCFEFLKRIARKYRTWNKAYERTWQKMLDQLKLIRSKWEKKLQKMIWRINSPFVFIERLITEEVMSLKFFLRNILAVKNAIIMIVQKKFFKNRLKRSMWKLWVRT